MPLQIFQVPAHLLVAVARPRCVALTPLMPGPVLTDRCLSLYMHWQLFPHDGRILLMPMRLNESPVLQGR